jgi:hypothetical protein
MWIRAGSTRDHACTWPYMAAQPPAPRVRVPTRTRHARRVRRSSHAAPICARRAQRVTRARGLLPDVLCACAWLCGCARCSVARPRASDRGRSDPVRESRPGASVCGPHALYARRSGASPISSSPPRARLAIPSSRPSFLAIRGALDAIPAWLVILVACWLVLLPRTLTSVLAGI